jgi:hypothetical protein
MIMGKSAKKVSTKMVRRKVRGNKNVKRYGLLFNYVGRNNNHLRIYRLVVANWISTNGIRRLNQKG